MAMTQDFGTVIGSALWDFSITADRRPEFGDTVLCGPIEKSPGGKGLNQAVALKRLGANIYFLSAVGRDFLGDEIREYCSRQELPSETIYQVDGTPTGLGIPINIMNFGKFGFASPGASLELPFNALIWFEENISSITWTLCHFETSKDTLSRILEVARRGGLRIYVNAAPRNDLFLDLVSLADVLIVNTTEAKWILRTLSNAEYNLPATAARLRMILNINAVVVTDGAHGATWATATETGLVPAVKVRAVDTVGAGDAFCAGLVYALELQTSNLEGAVQFASYCAALATTVAGAAETMPLLSQVQALRRRIESNIPGRGQTE